MGEADLLFQLLYYGRISHSNFFDKLFPVEELPPAPGLEAYIKCRYGPKKTGNIWLDMEETND